MNFVPSWNEDITRKQYILNHLTIILLWCVYIVTLGVSAGLGDPALLFMMGVGGLFTIISLVLSLLWMNNRLRDGGLSSEGWRIVILIVSVLSGIVGCLAFIYCLVKPTEDTVYPKQLEEDHASG
jgi:uncharacterized membrane protein YhaH (DUF805 family)